MKIHIHVGSWSRNKPDEDHVNWSWTGSTVVTKGFFSQTQIKMVVKRSVISVRERCLPLIL